MHLRTTAAFALAAALISLSGPSHATVFPASGGQGDRAEEYRCPAGHMLVGFRGRTGSWIDQIGLICAQLVMPAGTTGGVQAPPPRGGNGGSPSEQLCIKDAGIRRIQPTLLYYNGGWGYVGGIEFSCFRPANGSLANTGRFAGEARIDKRSSSGTMFSEALPVQECVGSEYATGLNIRYGKHVNAIGLICDEVHLASQSSAGAAAHAGNAGERLGQGMENNTDRAGADYTRFHINDRRPDRCQSECQLQSDRCKAWTYVRPGVQHQHAVCYLKSAAAPAHPNDCCISGLPRKVVGLGKRPPAPAAAASGSAMVDVAIGAVATSEDDIDRPGSDFARNPMNDALECRAACEGEARCEAWTFVRAGVQGPTGVCYLKRPAPAPVPNNCCISGTVQR